MIFGKLNFYVAKKEWEENLKLCCAIYAVLKVPQTFISTPSLYIIIFLGRHAPTPAAPFEGASRTKNLSFFWLGHPNPLCRSPPPYSIPGWHLPRGGATGGTRGHVPPYQIWGAQMALCPPIKIGWSVRFFENIFKENLEKFILICMSDNFVPLMRNRVN